MGKLDINTASQEEIERIHGIGAGRAEQIVNYREQHRGVRHIDELLKLSLFHTASEEDKRLLVESVAVDPQTVPVSMQGKLNLNVADHDDLERIRGIGTQRADILLNPRRRFRHFRRLDEIDTLPSFDIMDAVERDAIKAHLTVE